MTRRRRALAALGIALLGWIIGGEWVSIHQHVPENHLIDAIGGPSFLVAGLVALDRRPRNRMGWLMIAYVAVSYLGNWGNLQVAVVPMIGTPASSWARRSLAQMVLSYPTGRLRTGFERFVIGTIYAVAISVSVVILLAFDPRADGCTRCAFEPAPFPNRHAVLTAMSAGQRAGFFVFLLLIMALWLRWRRATPAERRGLAPLWVAACIYVLVGLMGAFASPDTTGQPFAYLVWELQSVLQIGLPVVFLWGLLSTRLARSAVGDLVMELEERASQPLAALIHDPALDQGLVRAAAAAAGMTIENERLQAEVRAQLEEVRASRQRIVEAGDAERRRVERNLHDGAQQRMATLALELAMLRDRASGDPAVAASLDRAAAELKQAIAELRELASGIHPAILTEEGLPAAVEALADRSSLPVWVRADFDARLPGPVEATAYFVVAESLANVAKYARASGARVELSRRERDAAGGGDRRRRRRSRRQPRLRAARA